MAARLASFLGRYGDGAALLTVLACGVVVVGEAYEAGLAPLRKSRPAEEATHYGCSEIISANNCRALEKEGYVVIDNAFARVSEARRDVRRMVREKGAMTDSPNRDSAIRTDLMCFLTETDRAAVRAAMKKAETEDSYVGGSGLLRAQMFLGGVGAALQSQSFVGFSGHSKVVKLRVPEQVQLALYTGTKTFYIPHRDGIDKTFWEMGLLEWLRYDCYRRRAVTAILYLTEGEEWDNERDGGFLRLYIGAERGDDDGTTAREVVDISPLGGRMVLFDAQRVLHEVRPTFRERIGVTVWFTSTAPS
tara:strand:+ start:2806 stop:3720 length:915 start_codon:yes stop_codon:yes gene_type:complete